MNRIATYSLVVTIACAGCSSMSNTQKGAIGGAAAGAAIGGVIGHQSGNTAVGAIIGAAVGGAAGAYIGNYMDKQAAEMKGISKAQRSNGSARASRSPLIPAFYSMWTGPS